MAPRIPKLVVLEGTPCHFCRHPRSSHSSIVLTAPCKVTGCDCPVFDPICGCGHLLAEHVWGCPPKPWECAFCACSRFGANLDGTRERRDRVEVVAAKAPPPPRPRPAPVIEEATARNGSKLRWGRRELALFDCSSTHCPDQATYWTTRAYIQWSGKGVTVRASYCGPHFRQWCERYMPSTQLSLFGDQPAQSGP